MNILQLNTFSNMKQLNSRLLIARLSIIHIVDRIFLRV